MRIVRKKALTLFALTVLIVSLFLVNMDGLISAQQEEDIYLHGPPLTPIHMDSNKSLVPIHMNSNMTLTPVHMHFTGPEWVEDPIYMPFETWWHELYPEYCQNWTLTSWIDNDDNGMLSPNDQIDMTNEETANVTWYHVDRVTWTLNLTNVESPDEQLFIEFKGPPEAQDPIGSPVCTYWHEVHPSYSNVYHIIGWTDSNGNGVLDFCDFIDIELIKNGTPTGIITTWHIEDVARDLILREKIMDPICTWWHEIYPDYCKWWHLTSWEDNQLKGDSGYGMLSPGDQIDMDSDDWYWDTFWSMGDVNRDGYINQTDADRIAAMLGWTGPPGGVPEDINSDGIVNINDAIICANNQGLDIWTYFPGLGKKVWYYVDRVTLTLNVTLEKDPTKWMKIELKTSYFEEMYNGLKHPVDTRWHEVYPYYSNVYELVWWDWFEDDNCNGVLDVCDYIWLYNMSTPQVEPERYHVEDICYDIILNEKIMDPIGTGWHELYPIFCNNHTLTSWEEDPDDPYPGRLSPGDQIDMFNETSREKKWYYVDRVTLTIYITINATGEPYYFEFKGPFEDMYRIKTDPNRTLWTMVWPGYLGEGALQIEDWIDNCNGVLDRCDYILLSGVWCHVEDVAVDIILNEKIMDPVCTWWDELYPIFDNRYHIIAWEDNGDGRLSPCDMIDLDLLGWYHVKAMTLTLYVTPTVEGVPMYIEWVGGFRYMYHIKTNPEFTVWHEVYPEFSLNYNLTEWIDNCNGVLDYCDLIWLIDPTGFGQYWHVEEVAIDIVIEPPPIHDVGVDRVASLYSWVYQGEIDPISVTVTNYGDFDEPTVDVYAFYDGTLAAPKQTISLSIGETKILTFYWDTTGVPPGTYTVSANATIPIDDVPGNNYLVGNAQQVRLLPWYVKPSYPDYAPSGMPDFDQKQDAWGIQSDPQIYTWCGPVAVANSLWWLDSEFESNTIPPPAIIDNYPLVTSYNPGLWDDHDPQNVDPLVRNLAFLMDTDGMRTGLPHTGTSFIDMETGISQYLQQQGVNPVGDCDGDGDVDDDDITIINLAMGTSPGIPGWDMRADVVIDNVIDGQDLDAAMANYGQTGMFYEKTVEFANFTWIEDEILRCEDVVLFLEFWYFDGLDWWPLYEPPDLENGHFVTCAGVNSSTTEILISDPWQDAYEAGLVPGRSPVRHPPHADPTIHNDAQYVSHDAYNVSLWTGPPPPMYPPVSLYELEGYPIGGQVNPMLHAFIRAAVTTSPIGVHDVAVTNVTSAKTVICQGLFGDINVTVENQGYSTETFNVTAYANMTAIGTKQVTLASGDSQVVTFLWNTTGFSKGNYTIKGVADTVPGEIDTADNTYIDDWIIVSMVGDITGPDGWPDGKVDMRDIGTIAKYFGQTVPPAPPNCDLTGPPPGTPDGIIDMRDIGTVAKHFGEIDP